MAVKGYPRTRFNIEDRTTTLEIATSSVGTPQPLAMQAFTADRGPEEWSVITSLSEFIEKYGEISYVRHGQPQLTVAEILKTGGAVLGKRIVDDTATLANVTICAKIVSNNNVNYVYFYAESVEDAHTFDDATINYSNLDNTTFIVRSSTNAGQPNSIAIVKGSGTDDSSVGYPLFTIAALGRGYSNLSFNIKPVYTSKKSPNYLLYTLEVIRNNEVIESTNFSLNPNIIINNTSYAMNPKINISSNQIKVRNYENALESFCDAVKSTTDLTKNDIVNSDIIGGTNKSGSALGGIVTRADLDDDGNVVTGDLWAASLSDDIKNKVIQLTSDGFEFSFASANGSGAYKIGTQNGIGVAPIAEAIADNGSKSAYEKLLLKAFGANENTVDTDIYDLDNYKVDFICDCGYPDSVKRAITKLVDFRGDTVFLADLGSEKLADANSIISRAGEIFTEDYKSKFVAIYHNVFDVYDPYSGRQITVTMPYLLASKLVNHIADGAGRPFAGILHDITFPEIIANSINFIPRITPTVDQKQLFVDANINYLSIYNNLFVMDTMYVNQSDYTQLSYLNNIMAIQQIVKKIRDKCPATRYSFLDGNDLQKYIEDASSVINNYNSYFKSISIEYMADEAYESNNIFYAVIKVQFKNFIQEEYFKIIALS